MRVRSLAFGTVLVLFALTSPLKTQSGGLSVVASAQCAAVMTVDPATKPDARTGWGVQFLLNSAPTGSRDTTEPYRRTLNGPPGVYSLGAAWTRSGTPSVLLPAWSVDCRAPIATAPVIEPPPVEVCGDGLDNDGDGQIDEGCAPPPEVCGDGIDNDGDGQIDEGCPPPPTGGIFGGAVDPTILGTCSAARHDTYVTTREGTVFRTWHPQVDPTGCIYAHEHGDNPTRLTDPMTTLPAPAFGYILSKTPGHPPEPHEGYKVFIENPGAVNDEDRVNRIYSRSVFHMGTGGPARFSQPHHSAEIYVRHPEFGLLAFTQLMMDTGGTGIVCDPRSPAPNKDVVALDFVQRCGGKKLGSLYEIWSTEQSVRAPDGREVYRSFATPALFDPITAFNPANPSEVVYIGGTIDPRIVAIMAYPSDTWWANSRGCDRESYAQPGYWYNAGGPTTYYTNSFGQSVAASDPLALAQGISASNSIGAPATDDGNGAFKSRPGRWCGNIAQLGLKN